MRVADKRSFSLTHRASPNTDVSLKTLEIVFSAVGEKKNASLCARKKRMWSGRKGAEGEVGGWYLQASWSLT